ncbi:unnamed protein product [Onchocerca flexuosa]|uniref:Uncharacterized protein n=1 Tax=Onchocerca flexuosa TaxID=387005 RepID=A0A183HCT1_9BILA|nr:unnamed protein product [Onchocerca flexuosa]
MDDLFLYVRSTSHLNIEFCSTTRKLQKIRQMISSEEKMKMKSAHTNWLRSD